MENSKMKAFMDKDFLLQTETAQKLYNDYAAATPYEWTIPLNSEVLRKGGNEIMISVLEGSWILFDQIRLEGPEGTVVSPVDEVFVRAVMPADYLLEKENGKV